MKLRNIFTALIVGGVSVVSSAPVMAQVTSVTQLRDVEKTNWAYQAITNLVEKYGCVAGYPGNTFKPGQSASRAELAAITSACLDRITEFYSEADASLAAALKAEFSREIAVTNNRVSALEVAAARKADGIGNYVGAGILLNQQGIEGGGYSANRTILGANIQGRYALKTYSNQNAWSVRPYVNITASPSGQLGSGGGALVSYDISVAKSKSGFSKWNVYGGVGYQIPFVNNTASNFQSAVGEKGQVVFALGTEARLTNSLSVYGDLKFPTTTASNSYGATNGTYSPVLSTGIGLKF